MVSRAYLLEKPAGPSGAKLFLDQTITPILINAAGSVEDVLERVAVRTRKQPVRTLATGFTLGTMGMLLAGHLLCSRRSTPI
ncbi:hypothetical protein [Lichenicoccus roseus]|uniref:Uncharacterized protein n=1 Tax=Lichenicoccus roseus TaxID=2683649 RepID=A0A5R9J473_9PROT|nr:hypothetical protein [Lichenicoccus roseus]TLU72420.1 hypothetical protein FE263_10120 [Lichenicoccus roseus]